MRECPQWFQDALTRIGGTNPYGEPVFRLVWSTSEKMVIGGRWEQTGFEGYKQVHAVTGQPCWALMVWEPREVFGSPDMWELDYSDGQYLACGGYPKYGRYRLLRKFFHQEIVTSEEHCLRLEGRKLFPTIRQKQELATYRMEPCGLMLDLMLPMLMRWRKLSDAAKVAALKQEEQLAKDEFLRKTKDALAGCRVRRGSQLVAKRAEVIEKGFMQAMAVAAQTKGLGMRIGD